MFYWSLRCNAFFNIVFLTFFLANVSECYSMVQGQVTGDLRIMIHLDFSYIPLGQEVMLSRSLTQCWYLKKTGEKNKDWWCNNHNSLKHFIFFYKISISKFSDHLFLVNKALYCKSVTLKSCSFYIFSIM